MASDTLPHAKLTVQLQWYKMAQHTSNHQKAMSMAAHHTTIHQVTFETPLGQMTACASTQHLYMFEFALPERIKEHLQSLKKTYPSYSFEVSKIPTNTLTSTEHPIFAALQKQLNAYFEGSLDTFDIPLQLTGTDFQKQVWQTLLKIPYGQTYSYLQQATAMNKPSAVRAVAAANGRNKISIIIPCHRVIGSNGALTGYGGELWRKEKLLALEQSKK